MKLVLGVHNHQPVGNFDHVIAQVHEASYQPFLAQLEAHPHVRLCMHHSGPLWEWLEANRPDYFDRLARLVAAGRVEILGGAFYEPILTAIPESDRIGQVRMMSQRIQERFGVTASGLWLAERVWEPQLAASVARAGMGFVLLDDYHFIQAGIAPDDLTWGPLVTEEMGAVLALLPISERLRYLIPFQEPEQTVALCRELHRRDPDGMLVMVDDGEKFGSWPDTYAWVYEKGWLDRFFTALAREDDWLELALPAEAIRSRPPRQRVYLPPGSYFEMTEWALPVSAGERFVTLVAQAKRDGRWEELKPFLRGGFWRQFLQKYHESSIMSQRALLLHEDLAAAAGRLSPEAIAEGRRHLWQAQCNCAYWHGVFGGLYLPHLRHAVCEHLIKGTSAIAGAFPRQGVQAVAVASNSAWDLRLCNAELELFVSPWHGCSCVGLEDRGAAWNLLNTLRRRREAYHARIEAADTLPADQPAEHASIHDRASRVTAELQQALAVDPQPRFSWLDRLLHPQASFDAALDDMSDVDGGDLAAAPYALVRPAESLVRDGRLLQGWSREDVSEITCRRRGRYQDDQGASVPIVLTKTVALAGDGPSLRLTWRLENAGESAVAFRFASEWNLALLQKGTFLAGNPASAVQRPLGPGALPVTSELTLSLPHHGRRLQWRFDRPCPVWVHEVRTVSQAESGFELHYQGHMLLPLWDLRLEPGQGEDLGLTFTIVRD